MRNRQVLVWKGMEQQRLDGQIALGSRHVPDLTLRRWDEKAGLRRDALSSQVIDAL